MDKRDRIVQLLRIVMPIVAVVTFVAFAPLEGIWAWMQPLPDTVEEQVSEAVDHGLDGIIVYVDEAGKAPALYAAGWKDKVERLPADPHALFKIASIHKLFVATTVARLVNDGRLSLDDTLADHLPELDGRIENADQITLRMMVQHRSGIPNFTDQEEWDWFTPQTEETRDLELVLDLPADFAPDTDYSYSNTNYLLLVRILEDVLGTSLNEHIENEILAPLGMTNTYTTLSQANYDDVVRGYWYGYDDDLRFLDNWMVASAEDIGIFLRALNDGTLLNEDEQAIYASIYEYDHDGWLPGYQSIARYHRDIDTVVIQFINTTGGNTLMISDIVYDRIVRILGKQ